MTDWLLFVLALALIVAGLAMLARQQLRTDGLRWAREVEHRKLYGAVSGKVLVRGFPGYDIYESDVVPEGAVVVLDRSPEQIYGMLKERVHTRPLDYPLDDRELLAYRAQHLAALAVYQPQHVYLPNVS